MRKQWLGYGTLTVLVAASCTLGFGQRSGSGSTTTTMQPPATSTYPPVMSPMGGISPAAGDIPDMMNGRIAAQQAKTRNFERQKKLESDTQKLVGLVTDLKAQVQGDKQLSPADISKRAEEIEKLARSVKDRMKG
ncbi:hypothetical protein [Edaphobacter flagellatus]|uniref:hypothetical protein n=1 Tax=Edaphobacter flagellatus TaxID=1933044 RepID=UPI0021B1C300|nr:hypothetical protein [Edaphobacter flagellatus]